MSDVLITGGAGFIGSELVRSFLRREWKVAVYDDFSTGRREFLPSAGDLTLYEGSILDRSRLEEVLTKLSPRVVCHLAALHFIPACNENPQQAIRMNTEGTENVLQACRRSAPDRVVLASSAAVYAPSTGPLNEINSVVSPNDIYGLSKLFSEQLATLFVEQTNIPTFSLRISNAVGPRETNPHVIPHIMQTAKQTNVIPLGNITPKRDYIHSRDVAEAFCMLSEHAAEGHQIFNVGTGIEHSVSELVEALADILGRDLKIRTQAERTRRVDRPHLLLDPSRLQEATGWSAKIDIRQSLDEVARFYKLLG